MRAVCIFHTALTFEQLLRTILSELKLLTGNGDKDALLRQLQQYLREHLAANKIIALIFDEAQNIPDEVLEEIRLLSNLETEKEKLLQIVFVGQPEFERKLQSEELRQLRQRIGMRRTIAPLPEKDIKEYIEYRLKLVGSTTAAVFTPEAVALICKYSLGIPRTINTICDNAFLIGYGLSQKKIDDRIITEVLQDMEGWLAGLVPGVPPKEKIVSPRPSFRMSSIAKKAALAILIICVISLIAVLAREFTRGKSPAPAVMIAKEVSRQQEAPPAPAAPVAEVTASSTCSSSSRARAAAVARNIADLLLTADPHLYALSSELKTNRRSRSQPAAPVCTSAVISVAATARDARCKDVKPSLHAAAPAATNAKAAAPLHGHSRTH